MGYKKWNENARLLVIKAVIKVELEILHESPVKNIHLIGRSTSKWDRVANQLPRYMRERTWNYSTGKYNQYKCSRLFYSLRQSYKNTVKTDAESCRYMSEPEYRLFKKRDEILKARFADIAESGSKSLRLNTGQEDCKSDGQSLSTKRTSESGSLECHERLQQPEGHLDTPATCQCSCEMCMESETSDSEAQERSVETGERDDATDKSGNLECLEMLPNCDGTLETVVRDHSDCSMCMESESSESEGDVMNRERGNVGSGKSMKRLTSRPTQIRFSSTSRSESSHGEPSQLPGKAKPAVRTPRVGTQALTRGKGRGSIIPTRPPARQPRASSAQKRSTPSMTQPPFEEILKGPLRCLDLEFSHLSSWVKSEAIPIGRELVNKLTNSALRASKRPKLNARLPLGTVTGPFEGLVHKSSERMMVSRIGALFHKLRIRLAEELKKTCKDIAQEVIEGS